MFRSPSLDFLFGCTSQVELGSQHGTLTESFSYDTPEVARAGTKLDPWNYYGSQVAHKFNM
jgi:hypothetical protein